MKTMNLHHVADIAYYIFWHAVTEIIQLLLLSVTFEACTKT